MKIDEAKRTNSQSVRGEDTEKQGELVTKRGKERGRRMREIWDHLRCAQCGNSHKLAKFI